MAYENDFDYTGDVSKINGIQFGIMSPKEIRQQSVVEITTHETFNGNEPIVGGLFDSRMGVLEYGQKCTTDMLSNKLTPGYFGHIELSMPVFYVQYFGMVQKIMKCVCFKCGSPLLELSEEEKKHLISKPRKNRWAIVSEKCKKHKTCFACSAVQPDKYVKTDLCKFHGEWAGTKDEEAKKIHLTPEYVLRLFQRLTDEQCEILGFNPKFCHPSWMICQVFPVCPPACRPSVKQENGQRMEDDLTIKYCDLIKYNKYLADKLKNNVTGKILEDWRSVVQYHCATLIDNEISGVLPAAQRSGRPLKALRQRLKAKEGRIRGNLMGKRVDFSSRTVITPDPVIDLDELGVPKRIAMQLTYPEKVTVKNIKELRDAVRRGPKEHPGARSVYRHNASRTISLNHIDRNHLASLIEPGDIVIRHINDGDRVLFNRQPSLHKMSMMSHRIRVLDGLTFRLNIAATTPYNADFDGDEMNMHMPQSIASSNELECLASLHRQVISPAQNAPIISFVQDAVVGSHLLTMNEKAFTHAEMMKLLAWNKTYNGDFVKNNPDVNKVFSGIEVLSYAIPENISIKMYNKIDEKVVIQNGKILSGTFDKKVFGKLIHIIFRDLGPKACLEFFNNTQHIIRAYLMKNMFSVGIKDLILDSKLSNDIEAKINQTKLEVEKTIKTIHLNMFENLSSDSNQETFEQKVNMQLNGARNSAGNMLKERCLSRENRFMNMVNSGSKGKLINLSQMTACLGPQDIDGKRVPYGYSNRTLPHFVQFSDGAESRGFVQGSFKEGLNPLEYFFHAMGGREGLIDTAVKTSSTGYIQRKLMKALEDMIVSWSYSVKDANSNIVQFIYGDDGAEGSTIEHQGIDILNMSIDEINLNYGFELEDSWLKCLNSKTAKKMSKSGVKDRLKSYLDTFIEMRRYYIEDISQGAPESDISQSINVKRLLDYIPYDKKFSTDLDPITILDEYDELLKRCSMSSLNPGNWMLKFLIYCVAGPKELICNRRLSKESFYKFIELLESKYRSSRAEPGEAVGPIAAQSLGEPCTQLTLNTFHQAGVLSKSNVTRGVPRLQELFHLSKSPKNPSLTVYLNEPYKYDKEMTQKIGSELELTLLRDIVLETSIYFDPDDSKTRVNDSDQKLIDFYKEFEELVSSDDLILSKWLMRLKFDKKKILSKNLEMEDIFYTITSFFKQDIHCIYTDDNSNELIMRIRIKFANKKGEVEDTSQSLRMIENTMLDTVVIKGVADIQNAMLRCDKRGGFINESGKFEQVNEWILDTDGSNFLDVITHPAVDSSRLISNDIHETYNVLGVEAVRTLLIREILEVIDDASNVDRRHVSMLVDMMTYRGGLISIDRNGMKLTEAGPLAKCSFEEADQQLYKAAIFADYDNLEGVSGNIMLGQVPPCGTGVVDIQLDEEKFSKYLAQSRKYYNRNKIKTKLSDIPEIPKNTEEYCDDIGFDFDS